MARSMRRNPPSCARSPSVSALSYDPEYIPYRSPGANRTGAKEESRVGDDQEVKLDPTTLARLRGKRVVTIGGGTGPFAVLSSLKRYPCSITAIVTMSDSGGSSRKLMDEFGQLPFGDLRQALVAL